MLRTLALVLLATAALAQHPDSLPLTRYGEPTFPGTKKTFQHVRLGNHVNDTSRFIWSAFGKIADTEYGVAIWGYQQMLRGTTVTYYFTLTDSELNYYTNFRETEDSDAIREIRLPIATTNSWQYKLTDTITATITGVDETVTVPGGTFPHCIVTRETEGDETITRWYAPDVGLVKRISQTPEFQNITEYVEMKRPS